MVVLSMLSAGKSRGLRERGVSTCDVYFGTLHSGLISETTLLRILDEIASSPLEGTSEVVLHPAAADADEAHLWKNNRLCLKVYRSPNRVRECEALKAPAVRERLAAVPST